MADKYLRPKNVENLKTPTVNNEIWRHLDRRVKNQDLKLSKTQALICKERKITTKRRLKIGNGHPEIDDICLL